MRISMVVFFTEAHCSCIIGASLVPSVTGFSTGFFWQGLLRIAQFFADQFFPTACALCSSGCLGSYKGISVALRPILVVLL